MEGLAGRGPDRRTPRSFWLGEVRKTFCEQISLDSCVLLDREGAATLGKSLGRSLVGMSEANVALPWRRSLGS